MKQRKATLFPERVTNGDLKTKWVPVVFRELKYTDEKYGKNTMELRFNLHGALQHTGLDVGQFVGLRGEFDGETLMGCEYFVAYAYFALNYWYSSLVHLSFYSF